MPKYRKFSQEYRDEAVKLVLESSRPIAEVARELGIHEGTLGNWVWLYLATVIDCHTRAVIGWSMAEHMRTDLVADAITMAAGNVQLDPDAVFHSDRGTQYHAIYEYAIRRASRRSQHHRVHGQNRGVLG